MSKRRKSAAQKGISTGALAAAVIITALVLYGLAGGFKPYLEQAASAVQKYSSSAVAAAEKSESSPAGTPQDKLSVRFIDVGQGDGILLTRGGHGMLIDAGTEESAGTVIGYIKAQKLSSLDYCIGTHPHEDHIGGMDNVINTFSVGTFILPNATNNTRSFSDVLKSAQKRKLTITRPQPGKTYRFQDATFTVLAPNSPKYQELNNNSVVIRLVYGNISFLFTGDAEVQSEQEMLAKGYMLKSDVLKVGHHGSKTSTSAAFLKAVSPKYAVISAGKGNDYGLPAPTTVQRLTAAGVKLYRTDNDGTVTAVTDGKTLSFSTKS